MKHIITKFFLIAALFLATVSASLASSDEIAKNFAVPLDVAKQTATNKDIQIYFDYSNAFYSLPDTEIATDIYHEPEVWDPLEPLNRVTFTFNIVSARLVIQPLAMVYSFVVPRYVREGIRRMDGNIQMPTRFINSLLQLRFERAGIELARFGINSTIGVLGFWDPADSEFGLDPRVINFGQTFAYWGIGRGFYIVLPIQGSTCLRDAVGLVGDYFTNPITYIPPYTFWNWISWGIKLALGFNNMTLDLDDFLRICQSSVDPYETIKAMWTILENIRNTRDTMDD